jgi:hypothetical protein
LVDAEMTVFRDLRTPVIWLQNVIVDMLLGLGFKVAFGVFGDHIRTNYGAEPGFITMNVPLLLDTVDGGGIANPIVCANINEIGFRMCGGRRLSRRTREASLRGRRHVGARLGSHPGPGGDRVGVVAAQMTSIVFGASSAAHIQSTKALVNQFAP